MLDSKGVFAQSSGRELVVELHDAGFEERGDDDEKRDGRWLIYPTMRFGIRAMEDNDLTTLGLSMACKVEGP